MSAATKEKKIDVKQMFPFVDLCGVSNPTQGVQSASIQDQAIDGAERFESYVHRGRQRCFVGSAMKSQSKKEKEGGLDRHVTFHRDQGGGSQSFQLWRCAPRNSYNISLVGLEEMPEDSQSNTPVQLLVRL